MQLKIVEIHSASEPDALNTEWFVLENAGDEAFSTKNCTLSVSLKNHKKRVVLGTLDPGFTLAPGQRMRIVTGNPGRKAHGKPPEDDVPNYNLFLEQSVLRGPGSVLIFALRSMPLTRAAWDPEANTGVAAPTD